MLDLGLAFFLAIIAAGIGKRVLRGVGELPEHPFDALALATPLGLGLVALSCLAVGELGELNLAGLVVLIAVATEVGLFAGVRLVRETLSGRSRGRNGVRPVPARTDHRRPDGAFGRGHGGRGPGPGHRRRRASAITSRCPRSS